MLLVSKPMPRYAVTGETVQDPYPDLRIIGPTVEADSPREAALKALPESPHSPEDIMDGELLVFEISDDPAEFVDVAGLVGEGDQ